MRAPACPTCPRSKVSLTYVCLELCAGLYGMRSDLPKSPKQWSKLWRPRHKPRDLDAACMCAARSSLGGGRMATVVGSMLSSRSRVPSFLDTTLPAATTKGALDGCALQKAPTLLPCPTDSSANLEMWSVRNAMENFGGTSIMMLCDAVSTAALNTLLLLSCAGLATTVEVNL